MKRFTKFATALSTAFLMAAVLATGASAHDNGAAQTPPMGWSSWNLFAANIDEDLIVDIADAMVEYNLDDAGTSMSTSTTTGSRPNATSTGDCSLTRSASRTTATGSPMRSMTGG